MKSIVSIVVFLFLSITGFSQLQVDKPVQLTGAAATDRKITGLADPTAATDAASAGIIQTGKMIYADATGSANNYAVSLTPAATAYNAGMMVHFKANFANTGTATLNVNGLGAKSIFKSVNIALASSDIKNGQLISVIYDGTNFQLLNGPDNAAGFTGSLAGDVTGTQSATVIAANAVTSAKIADATIVNADIANATITAGKISATGSSNGQVLLNNSGTITWGNTGAGGVIFSRIAITSANSPYAVPTTADIIGVNQSTPITMTLPAANSVSAGKTIIVIAEQGTYSNSNLLTIQAAAGNTISGGASINLNAVNAVRRIYSDGVSAWYQW